MRKDTPDIPWKATAGMRDKLIHHYFGVDYEALCENIRQDLSFVHFLSKAHFEDFHC
ncbi:MAG TPA: DUF86 domain-containing protein [Methanoregula sp.]|nr:DUF86 domain-containing protein [Methanoregula sp.]